jgi:hypothetical protein
MKFEYTVSGEDSRGIHLSFSEEVSEGNFIEVCKQAIDIAKAKCHESGTCAINFVALGVEVQVVESSDAYVQFALWKRMERKPVSVLQSMDRVDLNLVVIRKCYAGQIQYLGRVLNHAEFEQYRKDCGFDPLDIAVQAW